MSHRTSSSRKNKWEIMRAVIQRVKRCTVRVNDEPVSRIGSGVLVLLGVGENDDLADADYLSEKISNMRIFEDQDGKMNRSLLQISGEMMVVSQFTLMADCRKGRRPSYTKAADPESANGLYAYFVSRIQQLGLSVQTGRFGANMDVSLVNDGPVTLVVESPSPNTS